MSMLLSNKLMQLDGEPAYWCPGCCVLHIVNVNVPNKHTNAIWSWNKDVNNPTFSPSIHIIGRCHSFVRDGKIQFLDDCSHKLAGRTVELPNIPQVEREFCDEPTPDT